MKCYLCAATGGFEIVAEKLRYPTASKAYRCGSCELVFLHPFMSPQEERRYYEEEYGQIFSEEKGTTPEQLFRARLDEASDYLDWVREFLGPEDDCLEIGCASGYFLATIAHRVRSVAGVETHNLLREYCAGRGVRAFGRIEDCPANSFDRVLAFFVLEHLADPLGFCAKIERVTRPGGRLLFVVPNLDDALYSLYRIPAFIDFYFTPAHQFYYSRKTLTAMLERAGLEAIEIRPVQRYDLSNHIHWMLEGRPGGMGRFASHFSGPLEAAYAQVLEDGFLCSTLLGIASTPR